MIKVYVKKFTTAPIPASLIKKELISFLEKKGITSDTEVVVALIGKSRMLKLAKEYLNEDNTLHNVLSFTESETKKKFVNPPDGFLRLGEIAVCYPVAAKEANDEEKLVSDKVVELINHGALHLMGIHHD